MEGDDCNENSVDEEPEDESNPEDSDPEDPDDPGMLSRWRGGGAGGGRGNETNAGTAPGVGSFEAVSELGRPDGSVARFVEG